LIVIIKKQVQKFNMTFEEVSQAYIKQFGEPDQTFDFNLDNKCYIQWYWYDIDVVVEFICPQRNKKNGWEISYAMSLDPLKYFRKVK